MPEVISIITEIISMINVILTVFLLFIMFALAVWTASETVKELKKDRMEP